MGEGKAKATEVVAEESVEASAPTKSARAKAKAAENKSMKAEAEKPATRGRKMASATSKTCATAPATRPRSARLAAIHSCWSHFRTPIITIIIELPLPARAPPKRQRKPSPALTEDIDPDTGIFTDRVRSPRPGSPPPPPRATAVAAAGPSIIPMPPCIEKRVRLAESEASTARAPKRAR